jgi:cyclopropane fatty-acyl-phospholipid synthase-like methyltransferase
MVVNMLSKFYHPLALHNFVMALPEEAVVLDVGCGNNSPSRINAARPDLKVMGIDIQDISDHRVLEKFIKTSPGEFAEAILDIGKVDAVISNHNIEHVEMELREKVIENMCLILKNDGLFFLATPAFRSKYLPSRGGSLNYYDDESHQGQPLRKLWLCKRIENQGLKIMSCRSSYHPFLLRLQGLKNEIKSIKTNRVLDGTWGLYGFEQIIWAKKSIAIKIN